MPGQGAPVYYASHPQSLAAVRAVRVGNRLRNDPAGTRGLPKNSLVHTGVPLAGCVRSCAGRPAIRGGRRYDALPPHRDCRAALFGGDRRSPGICASTCRPAPREMDCPASLEASEPSVHTGQLAQRLSGRVALRNTGQAATASALRTPLLGFGGYKERAQRWMNGSHPAPQFPARSTSASKTNQPLPHTPSLSSIIMVKALFIAAVASAVVAASTATGATGLVSLKAAGASFPETIYKKWFSAGKSFGAKVNYDAVGSGTGVKLFTAGKVDFGASDKTMDDKEVKKVDRGVVQIPMVGGAVAVVYNKKCDLKLSQAQLVNVFLGKIKNWSALGCPAGPVKVVYRSDSSGTTSSFTTSLLAFNGAWKKVGAGKSVKWPVGVGKDGSSGVASFVKSNDGTISYVSYGKAKSEGLKFAALKNKAGKMVKPTSSTMVAGLSKIKLDGQNRGTDPNPAGPNSYPIVSYTWVLAYKVKNQKLGAVKSTLSYMLSPKAQRMADGAGFVKLPEKVRKVSLKAVQSLK